MTDFDGVAVRIVWVHADVDTIRRRLTDRGAGRDRWKLGNWDTYARSMDLLLRPVSPHACIDNSLDGEGTLAGHASSLLTAWTGDT